MNDASEKDFRRVLRSKLEHLQKSRTPVYTLLWVPLALLFVFAHLNDEALHWPLVVNLFALGFIAGGLFFDFMLRREVRETLTLHFPGWNVPPPAKVPGPTCGQCGISLPEGESQCRFCGWELKSNDQPKTNRS